MVSMTIVKASGLSFMIGCFLACRVAKRSYNLSLVKLTEDYENQWFSSVF
jgi:hypothetical protein